MTQVRFGNTSDPTLYKLAKASYEFPAKVENRFKSSFLGNNWGGKIGGFISKQLGTDFAHFTNVEMGNRFKTMIAEPPKLPVLFLLYPATVGPRLYRAWERGKENNDYREMGDVLRRDLTAITLFVFALGPMVKATSKAVQWATGVNLLDKESGNVLSYSQFKNYEITNAKALKQIIVEKNHKALLKAVNGLSDKGLADKFKHESADIRDQAKAMSQHFQDMKSGVKDLVGAFAENRETWNPRCDDLLEKAFKPFGELYTKQDKLIQEAKKSGSPQLVKSAEGLKEEVQGALKKYAKVRRLPTDMFAFAMMVVAIGWLPMAFNGWYNKRKFEEKMAVRNDETNSQPKAQALPLAQKQIQSPFAVQQPHPMAFSQPFGQARGFSQAAPYSPQQPSVNPFTRQA